MEEVYLSGSLESLKVVEETYRCTESFSKKLGSKF